MSLVDIDQHQRHQRRGRDIHLRAQRPDRGDEIDHPADFRFRCRIVETVMRRPLRQRQHIRALLIGLLELRLVLVHALRLDPQNGPVTHHNSSVMNGMNGCNSLTISSRAQATIARRLGLGIAIGSDENRLHQFEIPVAIDVPDEAIGRVGGIVEAIGLDRCRHLARRLRRFMRDPAIERQLRAGRIEIRTR